MQLLYLTLPVLIACGRVGFDPLGEGGMSEEGSDVDGGLISEAPEDFFALGRFDETFLLSQVSDPDANECHPSLTDDGEELYFTSTRSGQNEIYVSFRGERSEPFGNPRIVSELSGDGKTTTPSISPDGLTIWFASDRAGGAGGLDIYVSFRSDRKAPWSVPRNVVELNSAKDEHSPGPRADGLAISVTRKVDGRRRDLLVATRDGLGEAWSDPVGADNLNTDNEDADAFLDASGRFILFNSDRLGNGYRDIFVSTRTPNGGWGQAVEIEELNSSRSDADPWLSPNYRTIVFSSSRNGTDDLYVAKR